MSSIVLLSSAPPPPPPGTVLVDGVFTPAHEAFRHKVRAFIAEEIEPNYLAWETLEDGFPHEVWARGARAGLTGVVVPPEFGGRGGDLLYNLIMAEEFGASVGGASVGPIFTNDLLTAFILEYGTQDQKRRYLPGIVSGDLNCCFGLTEPNAGSDVTALAMRATSDGDDFLISGCKAHVASGMRANIFLVVARTDKDAERGGSAMTMFLLDDPTAAGFHRRRLNPIGWKGADVVELTLDNVRVPKTAILGEEGQGLKKNLSSLLPYDRMMIALRSLAVTQCAFDLTLAHVREREIFGQKLIDFQNTQFKLAEIKTHLFVGRALRETLLRRLVNNEFDILAASATKLWVTEGEFRTVCECMQLFGGNGLMDESAISRLFTFAKLDTIIGAAPEVQKATIARFL